MKYDKFLNNHIFYKPLLIGIIIPIIFLLLIGGTPKPEYIYKFLPNPLYGIVEKGSTSGELFPTYYVVRFLTSNYEEWIKLDSFITSKFMFCNMCDTNSISYISLEDSINHLVTIQLSPEIKRDTVLSIPRGHPNNVFDSLENFVFSKNYSVLAVQFIKNYYSNNMVKERAGLIIWKVNSSQNNMIELLKMDDSLLLENPSYDYTQIIFSKYSSKDKMGFPLNTEIQIFDLTSDSLIILENKQGIKSFPQRLNRNSPIFYLKWDDHNFNQLWKYIPGQGEFHVKVTDGLYNVFRFDFVGDSIRIDYRDTIIPKLVWISARK